MKRVKKPKFLKLGDILGGQSLGERSPFQSADNRNQASSDMIKLTQSWSLIVGEKLSLSTHPIRVSNKSLIIIVKHPEYAHHLSYLEKELLNKIWKRFPSLESKMQKINFRYSENFFQIKEGSVAEKPKSSKPSTHGLHKFSPQYKVLMKECENLYGEIKDKEIKESLTSLYIQHKLASDKGINS